MVLDDKIMLHGGVFDAISNRRGILVAWSPSAFQNIGGKKSSQNATNAKHAQTSTSLLG